jgi:hypothetical protein
MIAPRGFHALRGVTAGARSGKVEIGFPRRIMLRRKI